MSGNGALATRQRGCEEARKRVRRKYAGANTAGYNIVNVVIVADTSYLL